MKALALNLALAAIWAALVGVEAASLAVGLLLGLAVLAVASPLLGGGPYLRRIRGAAVLAAVFAWSLTAASWQLTRNILRFRPRFSPAFVELDARGLSPGQTVLFASLTSLTPGSLTVDVHEGAGSLHVHTLFAGDEAKVREELERYARLLRRATGTAGRGGRWGRLLH